MLPIPLHCLVLGRVKTNLLRLRSNARSCQPVTAQSELLATSIGCFSYFNLTSRQRYQFFASQLQRLLLQHDFFLHRVCHLPVCFLTLQGDLLLFTNRFQRLQFGRRPGLLGCCQFARTHGPLACCLRCQLALLRQQLGLRQGCFFRSQLRRDRTVCVGLDLQAAPRKRLMLLRLDGTLQCGFPCCLRDFKFCLDCQKRCFIGGFALAFGVAECSFSRRMPFCVSGSCQSGFLGCMPCLLRLQQQLLTMQALRRSAQRERRLLVGFVRFPLAQNLRVFHIRFGTCLRSAADPLFRPQFGQRCCQRFFFGTNPGPFSLYQSGRTFGVLGRCLDCALLQRGALGRLLKRLPGCDGRGLLGKPPRLFEPFLFTRVGELLLLCLQTCCGIALHGLLGRQLYMRQRQCGGDRVCILALDCQTFAHCLPCRFFRRGARLLYLCQHLHVGSPYLRCLRALPRKRGFPFSDLQYLHDCSLLGYYGCLRSSVGFSLRLMQRCLAALAITPGRGRQTRLGFGCDALLQGVDCFCLGSGVFTLDLGKNGCSSCLPCRRVRYAALQLCLLCQGDQRFLLGYVALARHLGCYLLMLQAQRCEARSALLFLNATARGVGRGFVGGSAQPGFLHCLRFENQACAGLTVGLLLRLDPCQCRRLQATLDLQPCLARQACAFFGVATGAGSSLGQAFHLLALECCIMQRQLGLQTRFQRRHGTFLGNGTRFGCGLLFRLDRLQAFQACGRRRRCFLLHGWYLHGRRWWCRSIIAGGGHCRTARLRCLQQALRGCLTMLGLCGVDIAATLFFCKCAGVDFGAGAAFGGQGRLGFGFDPVNRRPDRFQVDVDARTCGRQHAVSSGRSWIVAIDVGGVCRLEIRLVRVIVRLHAGSVGCCRLQPVDPT